MLRNHRQLVDWLRDEYGARRLRVVSGNKHARLVFEAKGAERTHLLSRTSKSWDPHAFRNAQAMLRRELGSPPVAPSPQARRLDEMMDDISTTGSELFYGENDSQPTAAVKWQLKMACYNTAIATQQLWFLLPFTIKDILPDVEVETIDDEHWKLKRGTHGWSTYGKRVKTTAPTQVAKTFGVTPAEAIEVDGELLVYLPKDGRLPLKTTYNSPPPPQKEPKAKPKPVAAAAPVDRLDEAELREIIRRILEIEDRSPYRLSRLESGELIWRAPTIRL